MVINEIYSGNELICFKALGISHCKILKIFVLFSFFVVFLSYLLSYIYPHTNDIFFAKKTFFSTNNFLRKLKPNQINKISNKEIFFTKIDKSGLIHNLTIIINEQNNNNVDKNIKRKTIFSKTARIGYNKNREIVARCSNSKVIENDFIKSEEKNLNNEIVLVDVVNNNISNEIIDNINDTKDTNDKNNRIKTTLIKSEEIDVLLNDFFKQNNNSWNAGIRHIIRKTPNIELIKLAKQAYSENCTFTKLEQKAIKREIHTRLFVYTFLITGLTLLFSTLLTLSTNRTPAKKRLSLVAIFGMLVAISRAYIVEPMIDKGFAKFYYIVFLFIIFLCFCFLKLRDKKN